MNIHPVVGELVPYESAIAPTALMQFHNVEFSIHGLCRVLHGGRVIEIVSVVSENEGRGNFSDFVDALIAHWQGVTFWEIWSEKVRAGLTNRQFRTATKVEDTRIYGMSWIQPGSPIFSDYAKEVSYGQQKRTGRAPKAFKKVMELIRAEQVERLQNENPG